MLLLSVLCSPNPNEPLMYSYGRMDMLRMRGGVRIRPLYLAPPCLFQSWLIERLCGSC